jgi:hypothetical protein
MLKGSDVLDALEPPKNWLQVYTNRTLLKNVTSIYRLPNDVLIHKKSKSVIFPTKCIEPPLPSAITTPQNRFTPAVPRRDCLKGM